MVDGFELVTGYRADEGLRQSFMKLAEKVFGIQFGSWYELGYWDGSYIPYSFADEGRVVANVSVNRMDLIVNGVNRSAVQLGTVMTHPDYRQKGLSSALMEQVLKEWEDRVDFIYLFANERVLDFYPKFGFRSAEEYGYTMDVTDVPKQMPKGLRKLDCSKAADRELIYRMASGRAPVSNRFGSIHSQGIVMFYCLNVFPDDIYYLGEQDAVVLFRQANGTLELYDVISRFQPDVREIVKRIADTETKRVVFHFTPDFSAEGAPLVSHLFVRVKGDVEFPWQVKHPVTSIT